MQASLSAEASGRSKEAAKYAELKKKSDDALFDKKRLDYDLKEAKKQMEEEAQRYEENSVADPDPSDHYVFRPHGSGSRSISQRVWIRILPSLNKISKKNLDSHSFVPSFFIIYL